METGSGKAWVIATASWYESEDFEDDGGGSGGKGGSPRMSAGVRVSPLRILSISGLDVGSGRLFGTGKYTAMMGDRMGRNVRGGGS